MYELIQVSGNCYYVQSPAKIGLVKTGETSACLIDSGNDKDAGKKVCRILEEKGWPLSAVYNTHSHADHIGGNRYLQARTGCRIYAPGIERDFTEHPYLEPFGLFGGNPPKDLRHKFLMAQESDVLPLTADVLPEGWEIIPLPGHSFDMAGFRTPDNIVYLADCLSGRETIDKYRISYLVDPQAYIETLKKVQTMDAALFIPAHTEPLDTASLRELAQYNIDTVNEIADRILEICKEPSSPETVLKALFDGYGLVMNFEQYALVGSTVRSYLAWLKDGGKLAAEFAENRLLWKRV